MSRVFAHLGMSLDGFIAGPNRGPKNPLGDRGLRLHEWMFQQRAFCEMHGMPGGVEGPDDELLKQVFARTGVSIIGKRMFEEGEAAWPENAPFHTPVLVLTHEKRAPWVRPGGTTFHFENDGIEAALAKARPLAKDRDVCVAGGASTVLAFLNAGLVDELNLAVAPILLGEGLRLFDGIDRTKLSLTQLEAPSSSLVTHLRYAVQAT